MLSRSMLFGEITARPAPAVGRRSIPVVDASLTKAGESLRVGPLEPRCKFLVLVNMPVVERVAPDPPDVLKSRPDDSRVFPGLGQDLHHLGPVLGRVVLVWKMPVDDYAGMHRHHPHHSCRARARQARRMIGCSCGSTAGRIGSCRARMVAKGTRPRRRAQPSAVARTEGEPDDTDQPLEAAGVLFGVSRMRGRETVPGIVEREGSDQCPLVMDLYGGRARQCFPRTQPFNRRANLSLRDPAVGWSSAKSRSCSGFSREKETSSTSTSASLVPVGDAGSGPARRAVALTASALGAVDRTSSGCAIRGRMIDAAGRQLSRVATHLPGPSSESRDPA